MPDQSKHIVAVDIRADSKDMAREMRRAGQSMNKMAVDAKRATTQIGQSFQGMVAKVKMARRELQKGVIGRFGGMARGAMGMAGVFGLGAMIQQTRELEMRFSRFGATAGGSIGNMRKAMNGARNAAKETSDAFGIGQDQVLEYAEKVQEATGRTDLALGTMKQMGKVAMATGADMGSLAKVVDALNSKLGVSKDQFFNVMDIFATQADKGSFELKNMAEDFDRVLNMASMFNLQGAGGARQLGALMQVARRGSPGAKRAATSAEVFLKTFVSKEEKMKRLFDFDVRDASGQRKQLSQLLPEFAARIVQIRDKEGGMINVATGKKAKMAGVESVLPQMFGEGFRTLSKFLESAALGGKLKGGLLNFGQLTELGGTGELLERKAKFIQETPAQKLNKALTKINNAVQSKMLPLLSSLANKMGSLVPAVQMVMDHFIALAKVFAAVKIAGFMGRAFGGAGGGMSPTLMGQGPLAPGQKRQGRFGAFAGKHGMLAGGALMAGSGMIGSVTGSQTEQMLDMGAGLAAMAGGPAGLIAGGSYFVAKMIVTANQAEIINKDIKKTKSRFEEFQFFADRAEGVERAKIRAAGGVGQTESESIAALALREEKAGAEAELKRRLGKMSPEERTRFEKFSKSRIKAARSGELLGRSDVLGGALNRAGTKKAVGAGIGGAFGALDVFGTSQGLLTPEALGKLPESERATLLLVDKIGVLTEKIDRQTKQGIRIVVTDENKSPAARNNATNQTPQTSQ